MFNDIRPAIVLLVLFSALTGLAYPLAITGVAQAIAPSLANGDLETRDGKVIGSALIGQNFASDKYFHGRPSATSDTDPNDSTKTIDAPYNAANSGASNLGPTSAKLSDRVKASVADLRKAGMSGPIPGDAVTTSASGLDPDISPVFALAQVGRVAKARALPETDVQSLVAANAAGPFLGVVGEPRVRVLALNLALDRLQQGRTPVTTQSALDPK